MAGATDDDSSTPFALKNAGNDFAGRSSDIFGGLDVLERQHITHEMNRTDTEDYANLKPDDDEDDISQKCHEKTRSEATQAQKRKRDHHERQDPSCGQRALQGPESGSKDREDRDSIRQDVGGARHSHAQGGAEHGQEIQFRRPTGRAPGRQPGGRSRVPDHRKHPENYTYYSLEDVKGSEMSEKSNKQAALAFLDERRKLREQEEMDEDEETFDAGSGACSKGLFSFAKRSKTGQSDSKLSEKEKPTGNAAEVAVLAEEAGPPETQDEGEENRIPVQLSARVEENAAAAKPAFKSRKGIRRNIRSRDSDEED